VAGVVGSSAAVQGVADGSIDPRFLMRKGTKDLPVGTMVSVSIAMKLRHYVRKLVNVTGTGSERRSWSPEYRHQFGRTIALF